MKKLSHVIYSLLLILIIVSPLMAQVEKDDISGFSTLLITPSAYHSGMGGGIGATATDMFALHSNPAGILNVDYFTVGFSHNQWVADFRSEYVGLVYHPSDFAVGAFIDYGTVGNIERRTTPSPSPEGLFDLNDLVVGMSLAYALTDRINAGITTKLVYEKIDVYSATGVALDFGMQYYAIPDMIIGVSFMNLGTKMKLDEEEFDLPKLARAGAAYSVNDFLFSADVFYPTDDDVHFHVGGQYGYNDMFFLRSGYQTGYEEKNVSFGLGFSQKKFNIDYAYVPFKSDLGDTHRISITYSLLKEE